MWNWDKAKDESLPAACSTAKNFLDHILAVNDPYFVACLDIGHAEMRGQRTTAVESIRALDSHLQALHLHDNDLWHDNHALPFTMSIDFEPIVAALREIGYSGEFTLEANRHVATHAPEDIAIAVKEMADATRRLANMFE